MLNSRDDGATLSLRRVFGLFLCMIVIFVLFSVRLFQLQIVDGEKYAALADADIQTTISIAASRGEILDRNQIPLVSNRTSYAVVLDYNYFPNGADEEGMKRKNDTLLSLIAALQMEGETWNDTLPISNEKPYVFLEEQDADVAKLKSQLRMASYATAENCMKELVERFELQAYTPQEQRYLAGIQYNMMVAGFGARTPYTFAGDVSDTTMYRILENNEQFPGVDVDTVAVREYVGGEIACHIIGRVGPIYAGEYEQLKDKGYSYNDVLGKSGIEAAAEDALRGDAGARVLIKNSSGAVVSELQTVDPVPGKSVILSIDSNLQKVAQETLDEKIQYLSSMQDILSAEDFNKALQILTSIDPSL